MRNMFFRGIALVLAVVLMLSGAITAYATESNSFNAGVTITETEDGNISVVVADDEETNAILAEQTPTLTVNCAFESAYVLFGETVISSTLADGKISFQVTQGGEYLIISGPAPVLAVAKIGDTEYASVAEALEAAQSGDVVQLVADATETDVVVRAGITLDLNGHTLTADYVFSVKNANIVDTSEANTGVLMVDAEHVLISSTNSQLPVWNGEGYVFTTVTYKTLVYSQTEDSFQFAFLPQFLPMATTLLEDGAEGNKVTIEVRVSWMTTMGREYRNLVFNESQVDIVVGTGGAFILTFSGFSQLSMASGISVEGVVISETGVSIASEATVVDVTETEA